LAPAQPPRAGWEPDRSVGSEQGSGRQQRQINRTMLPVMGAFEEELSKEDT